MRVLNISVASCHTQDKDPMENINTSEPKSEVRSEMIGKYFEGIQPHIRCGRGEVAKIVLLPGEPERVKKIASYFEPGSVKKVSLPPGVPHLDRKV